MIISQGASVIVYIISAIFLHSLIEIKFMFNFDFLWKVAVIVIATWFPYFLLNFIMKYINPDDYEKIRSEKGKFRFIRHLEN